MSPRKDGIIITKLRTLVLAVAPVVFVRMAGPVLIGTAADQGHGGPPAARGLTLHEKKLRANKHAEGIKNEHSNKGGALRGLDRAGQVAGEHGEQGREIARAAQAKHRR